MIRARAELAEKEHELAETRAACVAALQRNIDELKAESQRFASALSTACRAIPIACRAIPFRDAACHEVL